MSEIAIKAEGLSKLYHIGGPQEKYRNFRDTVAYTLTAPFRALRRLPGIGSPSPCESIWALRNVSFEVQQGEVLGLIGPNGSGKSTLLKVLSRITEPTEGRAELRGRVGSLLEVGTGFHPELTGRENIYLSGTILGMRRTEINRRLDEIVAFSEIGKFIETPVKHYSSGMYLRLAFAVAAHLEPEILLVDEVLAVGDASFQNKCLGKMQNVAAAGRTVLFVSHNMGAIQALCTRGIVMRAGSLEYAGPIENAISNYLSSVPVASHETFAKRVGAMPPRDAWFTGIRFLTEERMEVSKALSGQSLLVELDYLAVAPDIKLDFAIGIYAAAGDNLLHFSTRYAAPILSKLPAAGRVICRIPKLPLPAGRYRLNLGMHCGVEQLDHIVGAATLVVEAGNFYGTGKTPPAMYSKVLVDHEWGVNGATSVASATPNSTA